MTSLTRREFLQCSGILLAGSPWLNAFDRLALGTTPPLVQGRTLAPVTMTRANGSTMTLLPDSIVRIDGITGNRFAVHGGFVPRALIQPLTVFPSDKPLPALPFLAEVCAPVAPIRASCAANAPLLARIGHAGTALIKSRLTDGRGGADWYEIETGELVGWSQSTLWTPAHLTTLDTQQTRSVVVDRTAQTLSAFEGDLPMLQALVSVDPAAHTGAFTISGRNPSGLDGAHYGVPWQLAFDDSGVLGGAYWHNHFGQAVEGAQVQLAPPVARQLYAWLPDGASVTIR